MKREIVALAAAGLSLAYSGAHAQQKPCANMAGDARTRCLQTEANVARSIAQDRTDAARAYNRAYTAASVANGVAKTAASDVPGGRAAYGAGQVVGNVVANRTNGR